MLAGPRTDLMLRNAAVAESRLRDAAETAIPMWVASLPHPVALEEAQRSVVGHIEVVHASAWLLRLVDVVLNAGGTFALVAAGMKQELIACQTQEPDLTIPPSRSLLNRLILP